MIQIILRARNEIGGVVARAANDVERLARSERAASRESESHARQRSRDNDVITRSLDRVTNSSNRALSAFGRFLRQDESKVRDQERALRRLSDQLEHSRFNVARLDNQLRGLLVLGVVAFAQELISALVALGGMFVAVGSAAVQAGAAVGGAFVAGVAQAVPLIGLLIAAFGRVGAVFKAVEASNKAATAAAGDNTAAMERQRNAANRVRNAEEQLAESHRRVRDAQRNLTDARRQARRELEDLIEAEKRARVEAEAADLALIEAQRGLRQAVSRGVDPLELARREVDVQQARIGRESARRDVGRTRQDAAAGRAAGVEGSDTVRQATRQLDDARRAAARTRRELAEARHDAQVASRQATGAAAALNRELAGLNRAERRLFDAIVRLQNNFRRLFRPITDIIVNAFTRAVDRVNRVLSDNRIIQPLRRIALAVGRAVDEVSRRLTSSRWLNFFEMMGNEAARNIGPVTNILLDLAEIFRNIAIAAAPALRIFLDWLAALTETGAKASENRSALSEFFIEGTKAAIEFLELGGALIELFFALMGAGASEEGRTGIRDLTEEIQGATDWVRENREEVRKFFEDSRRATGDILRVVLAVGRAMVDIFSSDAVRTFADTMTNIVIPAVSDVVKGFGFFINIILKFLNLPFVRDITRFALTMLMFGGILGRIRSLVGLLAEFLIRLGGVFGRVGGFLGRFLGLLTTGVRAAIGAAVAFIGRLIGSFDDVADSVGDALVAVARFAARLGGRILDALVAPFNAARRGIARAWDWIEERVRDAWGGIRSFIDRVGDRIGDLLSAPFRTASRFIGRIVDRLGDIISNLVTRWRRGFSRMVDAVQDLFGRVRSIFDRIGDFIGDKIGDFGRIIGRLPSKITDVFSGLGEKILKAMVEGAGDVAGFGRDLVNALIDLLNDAIPNSLSVPGPAPNINLPDNPIPRFNLGGWVGMMGERGADLVPAILGRGEAVLNWAHQKLVDPALQAVYGFGLPELFQRVRGQHAGEAEAFGYAKGGKPFTQEEVYLGRARIDPEDEERIHPFGFVRLARGGTPYKWPLQGPITGRYWEDRGSHRHDGIDIAASTGTPVRSSAPGRVTRATYYGGYGNRVDVRHFSHDLTTFYAHLSSMAKKVGDVVRNHDIIGRVGNTGNSTGPHLHWGAFRTSSGASLNPSKFTGRFAEPGGRDGSDRRERDEPTPQRARARARAVYGNLFTELPPSIREATRNFEGWFSRLFGPDPARRLMGDPRATMAIERVGLGRRPVADLLSDMLEKYRLGDRAAPAGRQTPLTRRDQPAGRSGLKSYPAARRGSNLGGPGVGTHRTGEWQNRNAQDIGIPIGTGILAVEDGRISRPIRGWYRSGSVNTEGWKVYLRGDSGAEWFFTHNKRALVRQGERVRAGQRIAISGAASGVPHLHYAVDRGNPARALGWPIRRAIGGFVGRLPRLQGGGFVSRGADDSLARYAIDIYGAGRRYSFNMLSDLLSRIRVGTTRSAVPRRRRDPGEEDDRTRRWIRTGFTVDRGSHPKQTYNGGMSFAELLQAGHNRYLRRHSLTRLLGLRDTTGYGMSYPQFGQRAHPILVRRPGARKHYKIVKSDVGSGQRDDRRYTTDLHGRIADLIGLGGKGFIEVARASAGGLFGRVPRFQRGGLSIGRVRVEESAPAPVVRRRPTPSIEQIFDPFDIVTRAIEGINQVTRQAGRALPKARNLQRAITLMFANLIGEGGVLDDMQLALERLNENFETNINRVTFVLDRTGNFIERRLSPDQIAERELAHLQNQYQALLGQRGVLATGLREARRALELARRRRDPRAERAAQNAINLIEERRRELEGAIGEMVVSIGEASEARLQAAVERVNNQTARTLAHLDIGERMAALTERAGGLEAAFGGRHQLISSRIAALTSQRDQLGGLFQQAFSQGNTELANQLYDQIVDLNTTIAENVEALRENTNAYRNALIERISGRGAFQTGVFGNLGNILNTLATITGSPDVAMMADLLGRSGTTLRETGAGLRAQLRDWLGINLGDLHGVDFITAVRGLNFDQLELGLTNTERETFRNLINAIIENESAIQTNTQQLNELTGTLNTTQGFTSTAWQWFRQAIFTGSGGLLPNYQIPMAQAGAKVMQSGLVIAHRGEDIRPAVLARRDGEGGGNMEANVYVIEQVQDADPDVIAARLLHRYRHGSR